MEAENNPFKAPTARVADAGTQGGQFVPEGLSVTADQGIAWFTGGWNLFKRNPGMWIGVAVVNLLIIIVLSIVPLIGPLAANLLMPVFMGGIMLGCKAIDDGGDISINHLFAGFSNNTGNLVMVGVLYMVGCIAIAIIVGVIGMVGLGAAFAGGHGLALIPMLLAMLVALALFVPLAMALWFAPSLVVFHEVPPMQAMKTSFFVCLKNIVPFLLYGVITFVAAIVATLLVVGWLVLMPVLMASIYVAYKDMFLRA